MNLRTTRNTLRTIVFLLLLLPGVSLSDGNRPNVVVLLADDLGWKAIGATTDR